MNKTTRANVPSKKPAHQVPIFADATPKSLNYRVDLNRPGLTFCRKTFWRTCKLLGINNKWLHSVWTIQLHFVNKVEQMAQLIGEKIREHFLKVYSLLQGLQLGAVAGQNN